MGKFMKAHVVGEDDHQSPPNTYGKVSYWAGQNAWQPGLLPRGVTRMKVDYGADQTYGGPMDGVQCPVKNNAARNAKVKG